MQGFTDKALILGPDPSLCDGMPPTWKRHLNESIQIILNYCKYNSIDVYYLCTDEMMYSDRAVFGSDAQGIMTLGRGDMHFLATHNNAFGHYELRKICNPYTELIKKTMEDIPMDDANKNEENRITLIVKREAKVARAIIKDFNLIFNIQYKNHQQYKASTKQGDCRAVVSIDAKNFTSIVEMSGQFMSPIDVLEIGNGNLPVYSWEVPNIL